MIYTKLLSIGMFLDQSFLDIEDPFDLKASLENIGLFAVGGLSRTLLFRNDQTLSKGSSSSTSIRKKILHAIKTENVSAIRFMKDERAEIDKINEQYPVDSMNINRYQGLAKSGKIKDAQWINYFCQRYLSNIFISKH